jgi:hypothetical protein
MEQALPAAMRMGIRMRARVSANGLLFREDASFKMESGCGSDNSDLSERWDGVDGSGRRLHTFQGFLNWAIERL